MNKVGSGRIIIASQALAGILGVAAPILVARYATVEDFASYVAVQAFVGIAALLGGLGMDRVIYRFVPPHALAGQRSSIVRVMLLSLGVRAVAVLGVCAVMLVLSSLLGRSESVQLMQLVPWLVAGSLIGNALEMSAALAQSLFESARVILSAAIVALARTLAIAALVFLNGSITLDQALLIWIGGEFVTVLVGAAIGARAVRALPAYDPVRAAPEPTVPEMLSVGIANYAGYVLCLSWSGAMQRLLISMSASPATTAAFGLFLSLADRARLYLPVAFMERQLEPAWSADFHRRHHYKRFSASAGAVLKLQFYMLASAVVVFAWEGHWLVGTLVRPDYAPFYGYIVFMLMQLILGGYQAVLWMGANASRQPWLIWRSNLLAFFIVFAPLVYAGLRLHPLVMLTIASLPALVWVGYVLTRGSRALGSAVLKTPPLAQVLWLIAVTAVGFALDTAAHPLLALSAALGTYWLGVAALARLQGGRLLAANEWLTFSHYLGLARRGG